MGTHIHDWAGWGPPKWTKAKGRYRERRCRVTGCPVVNVEILVLPQ